MLKDKRATSIAMTIVPAILLIIVALGYNGLTIVLSEGHFDNPRLPFAVKIVKDMVGLAAAAVILFFNRKLIVERLRGWDLAWILAPFVIGCLMASSLYLKSMAAADSLGIAKNYGFYFPLMGLVVWIAREYGMVEELLSRVNLALAGIVVFGWGLLVLPEIYVVNVTYFGRFVGVFGNPNFMGFLCSFGLLLAWRDFDKKRLSSLGFLAFCGLYLASLLYSQSFGAILTAAMSISLLLWFQMHSDRKKFVRHLTAVCGTVGGVAAFGILIFSLKLAPMPEKITTVLAARSVSGLGFIGPRLESALHAARTALNWTTLVSGRWTDAFFETDGAFLNLFINFGLFVFGFWVCFFLRCVFAAARRGAVEGETHPLTWLLVSSLAFSFWIHYMPEKYPTCVFVALMSYVCLFGFKSERPASQTFFRSRGVNPS